MFFINRIPRGLLALFISLGLLTMVSCATTTSETAPEEVIADPDRVEVGQRDTVQAELNKVFEPINSQSELLRKTSR